MFIQQIFHVSLLLLISILGINSTPVPQNVDGNFPTAYNLHQDFTPKDINDLDGEQRIKAMQDVATTIEEVQKLLALDQNLPRLTK